MLTLADGSQIMLDSAANGVLAQQGNTNIVKQQDGQLSYNSKGIPEAAIAYNTLTTPPGGQYKLTLPDGSKVWLNAASSIKYPTAFIGNTRQVETTGEVYFEIAKDASKPFKVLQNEMEVEVLGTHFNINGYIDEAVFRTTLLEGSIKITTPKGNDILKPGQQAQVQKTGVVKIINDADLEETMAWKDGNFYFENSDIYTVMRQIARWYDVDVTYKGTVSKHFLGTISRNVNLSQVLSMLQQTGEVKFKIEGRKVIVMP
jgi:transmembrane sensor